jgi:hypothetical protein
VSAVASRRVLTLGLLVAACADRRAPEVADPPGAVDLAAYRLGSAPVSRVVLPAELHEISGLAVTADGRVFAHGDEEAVVYRLDPRSGRIVGRFSLASTGDDPDLGKKGGDGRLAGDFEDIAIAGERFFLVSSNGVLLEFAEGKDGESVPYQAYPTGLEEVCEVEGLAHDPSTESLLLLCKTMREKTERKQVTIYAWSLARRAMDDKPRLVVPWTGKGFSGSALAPVPGGRTLVMVAGPQGLFAEIGLDGSPVRAGVLDRGSLVQPESIAFLPDGTLLLASEGGKGDAVLASYRAGEGATDASPQ